VGKNLRENFFDVLDRFSPSLMDLFRNKRGLTGQLLAELLHRTKVSCLHYPHLVKFLFDLCSFCLFFYSFSSFGLLYSSLFSVNSFLTSASFELIHLPNLLSFSTFSFLLLPCLFCSVFLIPFYFSFLFLPFHISIPHFLILSIVFSLHVL